MLDKLELLLLFARERHFGRAAEAAGVSQPTFFFAVKSLEENPLHSLGNRPATWARLMPRY